MYVKQHIALSFSMNKDKILSKMKAGKKQEKNKSYFEDAWYNSLLFFLVRFYSSRVYIPVTSISNIVFRSIKLTKTQRNVDTGPGMAGKSGCFKSTFSLPVGFTGFLYILR